MQIIEASCVYTKQNLLEVQKVLHRRTAKICSWLALAGAAILTAGLFLPDTLVGSTERTGLLYFGFFWAVFFVIRRNHAARKTTRQTLKSNQKIYGCPVTITQKYYTTMVAAKNEQSGREIRARYDEVERVILTKHVLALILPDNVAILTDLRSMDEAAADELIARLEQECIKTFIEE
ncbi:MAG: hypothetical protein IJS31_04615 [Oscillospiraceae bacterium]|nr:hypothetical protein [Oscillospiraceae bacterium]